MSWLKNLLEVGIHSKQALYLQSRIRMTNIVILVGFPVAITYLLFYFLYFPPLVVYILVALGFILLSYLFIYLRLSLLARFILTTVNTFLVSIIHGFAVESGASPHFALLVFIFALTLMPWLVFDLRERFALFLAILTNALLFFNQGVFIDYFETDYSRALFQENFFIVFILASAAGISYMFLYVLLDRTSQSETANHRLLEEVSASNSELQEQKKALESNMQKLEEIREKEKERNWLSQAINRLNRITQTNSNDSQELYSQILKEVVERSHSLLGSFYLLSKGQEEDYLELKAAYACNWEKIEQKTIPLGEGILGQAALDKKFQYLENIPPNYLSIGSGLGDTQAHSLTLVPLLTDDKLQGIFEIARLTPLSNQEQKYLKETMQILGKWIFRYRSYQQMQGLLNAESQFSKESQDPEEMQEIYQQFSQKQLDFEAKEKEYLIQIKDLEEQLESTKSRP